MVSSTDGYCTIITFDEGELGVPYIDTVKELTEDKSVKSSPSESPVSSRVNIII